MQIKDYLDDIARSTGFLSRLPMPASRFAGHDGTLSRAAGMFPVAGLVIALGPCLLVVLLSGLNANAALTILIAMCAMTGVTGALHEDGLADSADALGARGGREHMLEIMKDSRIGTYGVLALVAGFALRGVALTILLSVSGGWNTALLMLAVAAASRTAMVWHWSQLPAARQGGVAASAGAPDDSALTHALLCGGILFALFVTLASGPAAALLGLAVIAVAARQWTNLVRSRLHGHTGDTLGATQQITETLCLTALALLA
ncbi:adenosylcobinamide-GDP ribazoletransferase [Hoeflea sp. YIM 152468]|uniref:adenosylcobinamide-GDP ribazoletransferase n=1 Tax=Hoeflea sp. YIM 152468 TaxID=3031759 RepID=UPI0023DB688A|nr:adenosylcobinamide-GDP ribazoletransferase [Hoeflea sp. YIM 152468]MDF1609509.1 adenosylcobinamide-GDP ribazoletransferase [Hoeflea sp. YIM 152468]